MRFRTAVLGFLLLVSAQIISQQPQKPSSSDIYHALQKLNFLGSALYVAAHPDDENTRLISYLSNHVKARTAYLSITRGDGGQNLIGPELRELLGVLRTQELLAARSIDGGEQFFTRANDFGYSKHPDETLRIWDKPEVLSDVVRVIREFKPDVIVNRFDHRTPGSTHGHHTSSAMLSTEGFKLAGAQDAYPEHFNTLEPWQPRRLFFNTSWWFYGSRENFEKADKSKLVSVNTGVYYPILGISNNEIASMASSQHKCQGFGRLTTRGSESEYLELLEGDMPEDNTALFEGINTTWTRVEGGEAIGAILDPIESNFNFTNPSVHIQDFVRAYELVQEIDDAHWKAIKSEELLDLIAAVCGLYLEASASEPVTVPGSSLEVALEVLNRSATDIKLRSIALTGSRDTLINTPLENNKKITFEMGLAVPETASYTTPYWLSERGALGMYAVRDTRLIGRPETMPEYTATFNMQFGETPISITKPIVHRYSEPDQGELYRPFEVLPPVLADFDDKVMIFPNGQARLVPVRIKALKDDVTGEVTLDIGETWKVSDNGKAFQIERKGEEITMGFLVTPPEQKDEQWLKPRVRINGTVYSDALSTIAYDHIPTQSVLLPAEVKMVRLDILNLSDSIGYIEGAGDGVAESLVQMGCRVQEVAPEEIQEGILDEFDAVVLGIRAYNVHDILKLKQPILMEYVKNGGTLIVQYNTAGRWDRPYKEIAPYPLMLSRDRVTDENSKVEIVEPEHPLMTYPNSISLSDFDGWVQERGLYFPNEWDPAFTAPLSMQDQGYEPTKGSLLVAPYGEGYYIYTGLSFFRELPAGVSGAFKLFANMLSIGKENPDHTHDTKG